MRCQLWKLAFAMVWAVGLTRTGRAQQAPNGTITGTVRDAGTNTPISDVTVLVVGVNRAGRTGNEGRFRIANVPTGAQQLRVARLGYLSQTKPITVTDGGTTTEDFSLVTTSLTLSQVVITGTAVQAQTARENGASIGVIALDSINPAPVTDFTDLLNARVSGVSVDQLSGTIGTAARIVVRGAGTAALNDQPLIVIDGVRAYNDINGFSDLGGVGGQSVSRFDDLDKESIEDVQVLKGASAAALYGTEAAAGVLVVTTRHGDAGGAPRWHVFGDLGSINNYADLGDNWGRGPSTSPLASCSLDLQYAGFCTGSAGKTAALSATPVYSFNGFGQPGTFQHGYDEGTGASVNGGSPAITYYIGANWSRQQGVIHDNADRSTHLTGAFAAHPYSFLDLSINGQYTQRRTLIPIGDNGIGGVVSAVQLAPGAGKGLFFGGLTPAEAEAAPNNENVDRFTLGSTGDLRPTSWLSIKGTVGVDYLTQFDSFFYSEFVLPPVVTSKGNTGSANNAIYQYTGSVSATAQYDLVPSTFKATTAIGGEWDDFTLRQTFGTGQGLIPGASDLSGATFGFTTGEVNQDIVDIGGYVSQSFNWRNVLYLTGAARWDGNSAFGHANSTALYPSGNISYVVSDERFWPRNDFVSSLRLRIAGGQTGVQPFFRQAQGSFAGAAYNTLFGGNSAALLANTFANPNLKPERSTEYEGGFDIGIAQERFTLTVTAYDKTERNLVQQVPVDISTGVGAGPPASFYYTNLGSIDNRGLEFGLNGTAYRSNPVTFELGANFYLERNKLTNLGAPTANIITAGVTGNNLQYDTSGFPLGEFFAVPYTFSDKHHNGIITPDDITYGSKIVPVGENGPREEFTISPTVTFFHYVRVNALFDRRDGITVYDAGDAFRCILPAFQVGRDCNDPHAPLAQQAAAVALNGPFFGNPASDYGYLYNGSFWKWRELSVTLIAPNSWVNRYLHGHSAQITISGRNLATWTNYRGFDPELNQFGGGFNPAASAQFFTQPPVRYWIGRVDLNW